MFTVTHVLETQNPAREYQYPFQDGAYHWGRRVTEGFCSIYNVSFPRLSGGCLFSYSLYFLYIYNIKSNEMPQKVAGSHK